MWVNNNNFLIQKSEIPGLPPDLSEESRLWWREQRRRCIEGYWSCGKWMPPGLYFYMNFWHILIKEGPFAKSGKEGKPQLWDIFWEMAYGYIEARGFAGFEKDTIVNEYKNKATTESLTWMLSEEAEQMRKNLPIPRDVLYNTTEDKGLALYLHPAKNYMICGNRGSGKSYYVVGGVIAPTWLFDGLTEYKPANEVTETVDILVGAGDSIYSSALLSKVKYGLERLPGSCTLYGTYYPSPFSKQYSGNFAPNTDTKAVYKEKVGGTWIESGTGSTIFHKSYRDNPFAGQGRRNPLVVLEEIGMMENIMEAWGPLEDNMKDGEYKFGTLVGLGTGGDMESGTIGTSRIFNDPIGYNLVEYDDIWEHRGKIGYFIPTTKGTKQYKDEQGITDLALAEKEDDKKREEIRKGKNSSAMLDARKQNQPRTPSEMFLSKTGNIFPRTELQEHLANVETNKKIFEAEDVGELSYGEDGRLKWSHVAKDRAIRIFPHDFHRDDCRGAIQIWNHPVRDDEGKIPQGLYLIGVDPYDHDASGTPSLGSAIVYMKMFPGAVRETIVAEYTGRHEKGSDGFYEQVRRLCEYYNAVCMFENNLIGMYKYFEHKNCTHLLMDTPEYAKETGTQPNRQKGMHFGTAQIVHGELLIKNWLEEEIVPGRLQLTKIKSMALLKELISYNRKGNFDRARALMCLMYAREETFRHNFEEQKKVKTLSQDPFWDRNYKKVKRTEMKLLNMQGINAQSYNAGTFLE